MRWGNNRTQTSAAVRGLQTKRRRRITQPNYRNAERLKPNVRGRGPGRLPRCLHAPLWDVLHSH